MQKVAVRRRVQGNGLNETASTRRTDLTQTRTVRPVELQNDSIAADLTANGSSSEARVVAYIVTRDYKAQITRDGRVTGSCVLSLSEGSGHWEISIDQACGASRTVKVTLDKSLE